MPRKHREQQELSPYQKKLRDPRWQKKRLEVLQRDEWTCQKCDDNESTLHVHHRYYERSKDPWDYPTAALVTLCESCHQDETEFRPAEGRKLLDAIACAGLFHEDVLDIAAAFAFWKQVHITPVMVSMLRWAMTNEEVMFFLTNAYFIWLRQNRQKGTLEYLQERMRLRGDSLNRDEQ